MHRWSSWRLRRHGALYWIAAAAAALLAFTVVWRLGAGAAAEAARWGETEVVAVAVRALEAGAVVEAGDVVTEPRPAATVPAGAAADPVGLRVSQPIAAGEVIVASRLAPDGVGPVAALVPDDHVAVGVPDAGTGLRLHVGDRVDLIATFDPELSGARDPAFVVAGGALVVDVGEAGVAVAVPRADAPRVAYALTTAVVVVALSAVP